MAANKRLSLLIRVHHDIPAFLFPASVVSGSLLVYQ